jgi:ABC-type Fe3+/spermidine/putrescine transport system ATPase subunit
LPEVRLVNVTKKYGPIIANDQVNLTIQDGEYVSVIGPSGCGKTTLIKTISGIIKPDKGEIYIDDTMVNELAIEDRGIGYVFQNIALFPHMSVWDNVTYGPSVRGWSPEETRPLALEMLELIKLSARSDAYPSELSGGTQQKTAVARALTSKAELLLLDEPLGALDIKVRTELRYELRKLVKDLRLTALHVTHDQEEAMSISDRVIVMKSGRIVEVGSPLELYTTPQNIFTANFVGEANFLTGIISKIIPDGSIIDIGAGLHLQSKRTDYNVGDRVVIAFRPEFTYIMNRQSPNVFSGTVTDVLYSGSIGRIRVRLSNGSVIVMKKELDFQNQLFQINDDLMLGIPPEHILVYPYPEKGLETELALE